MPRKEYTSLLGNINAMVGKSGKKLKNCLMDWEQVMIEEEQ